jgi:hypothetical protein
MQQLDKQQQDEQQQAADSSSSAADAATLIQPAAAAESPAAIDISSSSSSYPATVTGNPDIDVSGAVEAARAMARAGAQIIDVGGQSTRPGSQRLSAEHELARVLPVIGWAGWVLWAMQQLRQCAASVLTAGHAGLNFTCCLRAIC